jgi:hypothetical protein
MGTQGDWGKAFVFKGSGSFATQARAAKTWNAIIKFGREKKWDLRPGNITPKQTRLFLEDRAKVISPRSVQNEASHIRRAVEGAGQVIGDLKDKNNVWSSTRMSIKPASRIGAKAAADPEKWAEAKKQMPKDILAVVGLIQALGLRAREGVMATNSLKEWSQALSAPELRDPGRSGFYLELHDGAKGDRPRHIFVPQGRLEVVQAAVQGARAVVAAGKTGFLVDVEGLKPAMRLYSNTIGRLGLKGDDSGHGLRRAWAQQQFAYYRNRGFDEKESLRRLSNDLGHGDGRGRWVWNNYLLGGTGETA